MSLRVRVTLLVLTHICILFAFLRWSVSYYTYTSLPMVVEAAMVLIVVSQPSLGAVWAAFGGRPTPWRLILAALAGTGVLTGILIGIIYLPGVTVTENNLSDGGLIASVLLLGCLPGSALGMLGLRVLGMEVGRVDSESRPIPPGPRIQFSLSSMLQWVAAAAILLGWGSGILRWLGTDTLLDWRFSLAMVAGIAILTLLICISLWLALAKRHWRVRWPLILACPLIALVTAYTEARSGPPPSIIPLVTGALCGVTASMVFSLLLLRGGGLRVRWRRQETTAVVDETETPSDFDPFEGAVQP